MCALFSLKEEIQKDTLSCSFYLYFLCSTSLLAKGAAPFTPKLKNAFQLHTPTFQFVVKHMFWNDAPIDSFCVARLLQAGNVQRFAFLCCIDFILSFLYSEADLASVAESAASDDTVRLGDIDVGNLQDLDEHCCKLILRNDAS